MEYEIKGLTTKEASDALKKFGLNMIPEKRNFLLNKFFKKVFSPISLMLFAAAFLSLIINKSFDFYFILSLLFLNVFISIWQENKADSAIKKLNENLTEKIRALRDNKWEKIDSREIVPGDIIEIISGEVIPVDGILVQAKHVQINESSLTGESLPKEKVEKDTVYSGSFFISGQALIQVTATGKNTSFGKTLFSVERARKKSILEQDILNISKILSILSVTAVIILSIIFLLEKYSLVELLTLDLSLLIAGIPISLPTIMTLIIEFGVLGLATKNAVVRRLSALEDLANVNFLLTDKTGTLTQNKISVQRINSYSSFSKRDIFYYAFASAINQEHDPIDVSIIEKAKDYNLNRSNYNFSDFIPADSVRKRSSVIIEGTSNKIIVSVGAPQVIASLCKLDHKAKNDFEREVEYLASQGSRALAVAVNKKGVGEKNMQLVGSFGLSDTLREDAKDVIKFLKENGITCVMVTGDNRAIAKEVAEKLEINNGKVITKAELDKLSWKEDLQNLLKDTGAFAEILPNDKYKLVKFAKNYFIVASNGDGINDLPAIKEADVGIAVKNAVSALKSTADIVLLSNGISVIKDAVIESRKIFSRLYSYSVYRISESLRLIITITVLGIAYKVYPLTPLQLILIALLNDIPIISLAFDKVRLANRPAKINTRERFALSSIFGLVGVANSLILFFVTMLILKLPWPVIQTMFFLKLTVSGHLLIYVARTRERWYKFLPSKEVIFATLTTQLVATLFAFTGLFMSSRISLGLIVLVWVWSFIWMQIGEITKAIYTKTIAIAS